MGACGVSCKGACEVSCVGYCEVACEGSYGGAYDSFVWVFERTRRMRFRYNAKIQEDVAEELSSPSAENLEPGMIQRRKVAPRGSSNR